MSIGETAGVREAAAPFPAPPSPNVPWVTQAATYARMGAASVYHEAALAGTVNKGVQFTLKLLQADGLPTRDTWLIAEMVEAALKEMAAYDPTVQSGIAPGR
jgi:hypothetical protein